MAGGEAQQLILSCRVREMKSILSQVVPALRSLGFKGSGQNYRKATGEAVMVVNFQKSSGDDRFYVNLGVQPMFIPTEGGVDPDSKKIKEYECVFRRRVSPPEGALGWPCHVDPATVDQLRSRIASAYEGYLAPLAKVPGPVTELTPEEFRSQHSGSIFGGAHPLNALNFARIALARGHLDRAKEFAELGLSECPPTASVLKACLQEVIGATEQSTGGDAEDRAP